VDLRRADWKSVPQLRSTAAEYREFPSENGDRENVLDWLAEGVGFEPTRPFQA
jgi:hypothetical protein